ncbi:MAG: TetR/AcrR family transcriptional regulator [Bacillota bacterium]|nr:TetR/AcrR family transcriptional regulator [Bacillota bacterium]
MNQREQQRVNREKQIRECCLDLFISHGYAAAGIRDIAKKLNIATGVFFNYFESKEKVYFELIKEGADSQKFIKQMLSVNENPIQTLRDVADKVLCVFGENGRSLKLFVLMMQAYWSNATPEVIKSLLKDYDLITPTVSLISAGQETGQIREGEPKALSAAFWSALQGLALNKSISPDLPFPKSDWIVAILKP